MSASPTTRNRFKKPEVGAELNTWGDAINDGVISLSDDSLDGWVTISSGGATTLSSNNYTADQSRMRLINYTAATAGVLTIPAVQKWYLVRAVAANVEITNGGTSVTVLAGDTAIVATDGSAVYKIQSNDFNSRNIVNVLDPISNQHAATKKYVDDTAFASQSGSFPGQTGNAGKVLGTDGTNPEWVARLPTQSAGTNRKFLQSTGVDQAEAWEYAIEPATEVSSNVTAVNGKRYKCNTTAGSFTVTAPASPAVGDRFIVFDGGNTVAGGGFSTNKLTVARNGSTFNGSSDDLELTAKGLSVSFECIAANQWWVSNGN